MELALITVQKIIGMFIILLMGVLIRKRGMISDETDEQLSSVLLNIVAPCVILMSYQREFDAQLLGNLGIAAALSVCSFAIAIALSLFLVRGKDNPDVSVERMAIVYSNGGFIGLPLVNAVLGAEGVFYMTAYITCFNIFVWSHGVITMTGHGENLAKTLKNLIQPSMIAIVVSLLLFVFGILLPEVITDPIDMIGDMQTPLAMMIAGVNLADSDILAGLKRLSSYWISFLKLLVVPLLTLAVLAFVNVDTMIKMTVLIASACPTGTYVTLFALRYKKNGNYASEVFTMTTVLSLITMPLMVLLAGIIF